MLFALCTLVTGMGREAEIRDAWVAHVRTLMPPEHRNRLVTLTFPRRCRSESHATHQVDQYFNKLARELRTHVFVIAAGDLQPVNEQSWHFHANVMVEAGSPSDELFRQTWCEVTKRNHARQIEVAKPRDRLERWDAYCARHDDKIVTVYCPKRQNRCKRATTTNKSGRCFYDRFPSECRSWTDS